MTDEKLNNFTIELPENVKYIISTIEGNNLEAYAVGGCVRDTILGKEPDDWDITTSALPTQVKSFFKRTIDTGIAHGTVTVMLDKTGYEVTTYRIDGDYSDGRHPDTVEFSVRLVDDLMRRDFTINAMAYNDKYGLVDEFDGITDLNNKIIRCVGKPEERFSEDALRMMRAIRFSAQLTFSIENNTLNAIRTLAPTISKISMERIHVELGKTLLSPNPDYVLMYSQTGLFKYILPVLDNELKGKYSKKILTTLRLVPADINLRYAALFSASTSDEAVSTLRTLKMDNKTIDTVSKLVKYSQEDIEETEPAVRTALNNYGRDIMPLLHELMLAKYKASEEITGIKNPSRIHHLLTIKRLSDDILERGDCFTIKDLDISGNDLIEYGLKGQEIGDTLKALLDVVIENPKLNEKGTLIALIEHIK